MFVDGAEIVPPAREPWQQLLLDAADYIDKQGWAWRTWEKVDGSVCPQMAILKVAGTSLPPHVTTGDRQFYSPLALKAIEEMEKVLGTAIPTWNDNFVGMDDLGHFCPKRANTEVIAKLRAVANGEAKPETARTMMPPASTGIVTFYVPVPVTASILVKPYVEAAELVSS